MVHNWMERGKAIGRGADGKNKIGVILFNDATQGMLHCCDLQLIYST